MAHRKENAAELMHAEPLDSLTIHGRTFRVGTLTPAQWADIDVHERRLEQARLDGQPLHADERDPTHLLMHLLWSGSRHAVYRDMLPYLKHDHLVAARREATRQRLVAGLAH